MKKQIVGFFSVMALLILFAGGAESKIYQWIDKGGIIHYTDDPTKIPPRHSRKRIEVLKENNGIEEEEAPATKVKPPQQKVLQTLTLEEEEEEREGLPAGDSKAFEIVGAIEASVDKKERALYLGKAKNGSAKKLREAQIILTLKGKGKKELAKVTAFFVGEEGEGFVSPGEVVSFKAPTSIKFNDIVSYSYQLNWKYLEKKRK